MAAPIRDAKEDGNTPPPPPPPKPNPNADDTLRNTPPLPNPDADDTNVPPRTNPRANPNADDSLPIGTRNTPPPLPTPNPVADETNAPPRTSPGANPIADDRLPIGTRNTPPPPPPPNPDADDTNAPLRTNPGAKTNADDTLSIGTRNTPPPPNSVADDTNAPSWTYSDATNPAAGYLPLPPRPHGPPPSPPPRLLSRPPPSPSTPRKNANAVASEITAAISDISAALRASGGRRGPHSPTQADILAAVRAIAEAVGSPRTPPLPPLPPPPPPRPPRPEVTEQPHNCMSCIRGLFHRHQSTEPAPLPVYFVTSEQKNYLELLEKKCTRLNREELDLDKRCEEIETYLVTNLTMYIAIMAGGTFVGGSLKDTKMMYFLLGILAVAFFFGTLVATLMVYYKLKRLWWCRFDIWRRKGRLLGLIVDFSAQIECIMHSPPVASSSLSLDFAKIRLSELMSTSVGGKRGPSYMSHNCFVGVQFTACLACLGVMIYWAFLVSRGKMDFMFFGKHGRRYLDSPS